MPRKTPYEIDEVPQIYPLISKHDEEFAAIYVPKQLPCRFGCQAVAESETYNLICVDVSTSMRPYWSTFVSSWQTHIKDKLQGRTNIYTLSDPVDLIKVDPNLSADDFKNDPCKNFLQAVQTIRKRVSSCKEKYVRILMIINGRSHNSEEHRIEEEIKRMEVPDGKTINVIIFAIGNEGPSRYCSDIRSMMHNGSANVPSFYWAKSNKDIFDQAKALSEYLKLSIAKLQVSVKGRILPGGNMTDDVHLGEWLYFEESPKDLKSLMLSVNGGEFIPVEPEINKCITYTLIDNLFRQWNSTLYQQYIQGKRDFEETFKHMEQFYDSYNTHTRKFAKENNKKSILKCLKAKNSEFRTTMNKLKAMTSDEKRCKGENKLAKFLMNDLVPNTKFDAKLRKLRGFSKEDFKEHMKTFKEIYEKAKPLIMELDDTVLSSRRCALTQYSTLDCLKDPGFYEIMKQDKYEFMKNFVMSGIAVFSNVRCSSQINPWSIVIEHILVHPYNILSQQGLVGCAEERKMVEYYNKSVKIVQQNEKTRFNIVIPTVHAEAAEALRPIVQSGIYRLMTTFCILKDPTVIDYMVHFAALGCTWIKTIQDFPMKSRPEYINERLSDIRATAKLYLDRPSQMKYVNALINQPEQALMTESLIKFSGKVIRCESLVKPAFFMYLYSEKFSEQLKSTIFKLILFEFIGRCLCSSGPKNKPYTKFFCQELKIQNDESSHSRLCKAMEKALKTKYEDPLSQFYTCEEMISRLQQDGRNQLEIPNERILQGKTLEVNMKKVKNLKRLASCGDMKWTTFQVLAQELNIPDAVVEEIQHPKQIAVYVYEALHKDRKRVTKTLPSYEEAMQTVKKMILKENARVIIKDDRKETCNVLIDAKKKWTEAYDAAHEALAMPLAPERIVSEARARGVDVTMETFNEVYKYDTRKLLLRNACQVADCPHYLLPKKNFSSHLATERKRISYPHSIHCVARDFCKQGVDSVLEEVASGRHSGRQRRKETNPQSVESLSRITDDLANVVKAYASLEDDC